MVRKKFPIGIQTFEKIVTDGYHYVDKTAQIYEMASEGEVYFLSRPRRFGKSLLVSTLEAYFQGRRELFEGLAISAMEKEWNSYPVIRLDFSGYTGIDDFSLLSMIGTLLEPYERKYGIENSKKYPGERFRNLIETIHESTGKKAVVLVDEYDKPILDVIGNDGMLHVNREILRRFYGALKADDPYLKFVFLTGITKFSQVSIFSGLNQLEDISMDPKFDSICGITEEELESCFHDDIMSLSQAHNETYAEAAAHLRRMYDGYHFSRLIKGVYNPFSLLHSLKKCEYGKYWFETGTPAYLGKLLKRTDYDITKLDGIQLESDEFADCTADAERPIPMIYQSGYLTIKEYDETSNTYTLGYPNGEVRSGFLKFLTTSYFPATAPFSESGYRNDIISSNVDGFMTRFQAHLASVDYRLFDDRTKEKYFQFIFYLVFSMAGAQVRTEECTCSGRMDAVIKTDTDIFIFEFKLDKSAEEALSQINTDPYLSDGRRITLIGANFTTEGRRLDKWKTQRI